MTIWEQARKTLKNLQNKATSPQIISPLPQRQTLMKPSLGQQLKTGTANPLLQGIYNLPESMKITAQRIPGAINTMVMNPQQAGNLARTAPQYSQLKVPGLQATANFSANYGQTFGQGLQNMAMGVDSIKNKPTAFGKVQGGAKLLKGAGQTMVPFTVGSGLPFLVTNAATSFPQSKIPFFDNLQRFSAGVQHGLAQDSTLSPNIKSKNTINFNIGDNKISFDPTMGVGEMLGFVKNPVNAKLFKMTEKVFPAGQLFNKNQNLIKWLSVTPLRGSVENILIDLDRVPENASREDKIKFMLGTAATGAVSEIVGRGGMDAVSGGANSKVGKISLKYLADAFDELKNAYRLANVPVATNRWKNGERIVEPLWRAKIGQGMEFARKNEGFINIGADVGKKNVAQQPLSDITFYRGTSKPQTGEVKVADTYGLAYGKGVYLANDKKLAQDYGQHIAEYKVNWKNPWPMDEKIPNNIVDKIKKDFPNSYIERGMTGEDIHAEIGGNANEANAYLQKLGYDGLKNASTGNTRQQIIFNPQNVISKTQSSPTPQGKPSIGQKAKELWKDQRGFIRIGAEVGKESPEVSAKSSSQPIISQAYNAEPTQETLSKIATRKMKIAQQNAQKEYEEWYRAFKQQETPRTITGALNDVFKEIKTNTTSPVTKYVNEYKDISGFNGQARDVYRNFKQVFGSKYADVKRTVLDPFDKSKGQFTHNLENWANELDTNIVKKYGFRKGSKESAAIQQYGEGTISYEQLVKNFGEKKANNIVEADKWFRDKYDSLLEEVNAVRAKIYPNNPSKIIPRRKDYYRHFREIQEGLGGLINIFDSPANIQSSLAGTSAYTKPKSKWLSFAQKRLGGESDIDAVGGFINYVKAAEYAKNIDPHISRFRALREELAQATDLDTPHSGKLNNFLEFLDNFANDLAGKTSPADRFIQSVIPGGRKAMSVINWVNNRVKANVILGNASSSLAQIMNLPQGIANAGPIASTKGLGRTVASIFDNDKVIKQSDFIAERYSGGTFNRFDRGMVKNTKKMAAWMIQVLDEVGTKYIWNSHYEKALAEGVPNPVKYADDFTREMVAGRGIGEVPLIQKSKVFQLVAPFQLEVGNLWHVMGGMVSEKQFGKLATLFITSYIFNRGIEKVRGSDVSFDPINASVEAYQAFQEEDDKLTGLTRAGGRLTGEVLSNIPFGQSLAAAYPEYGMTVGNYQFPTRKNLFGKGDPTRFGTGLLAVKGMQDPLFKLLPPFGGQQLKRTLGGIGAYMEGMSTTPTGRKRYDIEKTPFNLLRSGVFGEYSIPSAKDYFNSQGISQSKVIFRQIDNLKTPEEKALMWNQLVKEGKITKDNAGEIIKWINYKKLGVTSKDAKLLNLGVKSGDRARVIAKQFNSLKSKEDKMALWEKYVKVKIITNDVADQLIPLLEK